MRIWPVIIDSRPEYLRAAGDSSLLLAPLGAALVATHVRAWLDPVSNNAPIVISPGASDAYAARIREIWPTAQIVTSAAECIDAVGVYEPSDALLMIDPITCPPAGFSLSRLVEQFIAEPRAGHHLVALEKGVAGTKERLHFDAGGRVRGVIRHYEPATWPFISGVAAAMVPVASGVLTGSTLPRTLVEVRQTMTSHGVPCRDVPTDAETFDLSSERGLLAANEAMVLQLGGGPAQKRGPICFGEGQSISDSARVVGHVVVQSGAFIGANVTLVGPAVIGAGARIEDDAVVAGAVVGGGAVVSAGQTVRDRVWSGIPGADAAPRVAPFADRRRAGVPLEIRKSGQEVPQRRLGLKRALDVTASAAALLLLSPLLLLAGILVKLGSDGPIFYGDTREGVGGRVFRCWKFRTMAINANAVQKDLKAMAQIDGPHFKMDRDPRVTRVGRLLRATNLDELPQLFNVLVGQMSLVGPRPSPFRENQICVPWREARLSVPPGITGMWQVCRHDRAAGDFHQWIEYDLLYVRNISVWLDLKILAATIFTAGGKAGHVSPQRLLPHVFDTHGSPEPIVARGMQQPAIDEEKTA